MIPYNKQINMIFSITFSNICSIDVGTKSFDFLLSTFLCLKARKTQKQIWSMQFWQKDFYTKWSIELSWTRHNLLHHILIFLLNINKCKNKYWNYFLAPHLNFWHNTAFIIIIFATTFWKFLTWFSKHYFQKLLQFIILTWK